MVKGIFVNLAVKNLTKSMEFFEKLGFEFNQQFTNENGACLVLGENIFAMLLMEDFFATFTTKSLCDPTKNTEVLLAVSLESRTKVDEITQKAVDLGGKETRDPQDYGWMYSRAFEDLDGHTWEPFYSDEAALEQMQNQ